MRSAPCQRFAHVYVRQGTRGLPPSSRASGLGRVPPPGPPSPPSVQMCICLCEDVRVNVLVWCMGLHRASRGVILSIVNEGCKWPENAGHVCVHAYLSVNVPSYRRDGLDKNQGTQPPSRHASNLAIPSSLPTNSCNKDEVHSDCRACVLRRLGGERHDDEPARAFGRVWRRGRIGADCEQIAEFRAWADAHKYSWEPVEEARRLSIFLDKCVCS